MLRSGVRPPGPPGPEAADPIPAPGREDAGAAARPDAGAARAQLAEAVRAFMAATEACPAGRAPVHLIEAGLGLGKTRAAMEASAARLRALRAAGDLEAAAVFAVPFHRLSDQLAEDCRAIAPDLRVTVLRGMAAEPPGAPGETMCGDLEAVREARRVLLTPREHVCPDCPLRDGCRYLAQDGRVADVYILAHDALVQAPPTRARGQRLDHLVIDENPLDALRHGVEGEPPAITVAGLDGMRVTPWRGRGLKATEAEAKLRDARARLRRAAEANGPGPLGAGAAQAAGLTGELVRAAHGHEWARKTEPPAPAGMLEHNATIPRMARIWRELARLLETGEPSTARLRVGADPEHGLRIRISGVRPLSDGFAAAPTLLLDATPAPELLARHIGRLDVHERIHAEAPHCRVAQDWSWSYSKSGLTADLEQRSPSAKAAQAARNNRRRLAAFLRRHARRLGGRGLVVANKRLAEALAPELPAGVEIAHFNALRGLNRGERVRWLVVVGRPLPSGAALRRIAEATTGRPLEGELDKGGTVARQVRDARGVQVVAARGATHSDPIAAEVLTQIRDGEVVQGIGRGRGVNRTAAAPLDVLVLSDAVMPFPVARAAPWARIREESPAERMLDAAGVVFASPAHAARAFPQFWATLDAAKKAFARGGAPGDDRHGGFPVDPCPLVEARVKLRRARDPATVWIDPTRHPDPRSAVEDLLGELAVFERVGSGAPADRPAGPRRPGRDPAATGDPAGIARGALQDRG